MVTRGGEGSLCPAKSIQGGWGVRCVLPWGSGDRGRLCPPSLCDPVQGTCLLSEHPHLSVKVGRAPHQPPMVTGESAALSSWAGLGHREAS